MKREELEKLAEKYQQKADKAFQNYQETGMTRYDREHRTNEDLAEALRMAARAADDSSRLVDLRVTLAELGSRAATELNFGTDETRKGVLRDIAASARIRGLIH